jgi:prevent-host-death family protein
MFVKELSATDAARHFSELLDEVEHKGASFVVKRRGKTIAKIGPATPSTAGALKEILRKYPVDSGWEEELKELRASLPVQERSWSN